MSIVFKPTPKDHPLKFDPNLIQSLLNENALLIKIIVEYQNKGKAQECAKYQNVLNRNLIYLGRLSNFQADDQFMNSAAAATTTTTTITSDTASNSDNNHIEPATNPSNTTDTFRGDP